MTKDEVVIYYGGVRATAEALKISVQAVHQWSEVPHLMQYKIQVKTKGKLKADGEKK